MLTFHLKYNLTKNIRNLQLLKQLIKKQHQLYFTLGKNFSSNNGKLEDTNSVNRSNNDSIEEIISLNRMQNQPLMESNYSTSTQKYENNPNANGRKRTKLSFLRDGMIVTFSLRKVL
jgi:hypothetical protein